MKFRLVACALLLALVAACCGCSLQNPTATFSVGDMTYEYETFFDKEQSTAEYRMAMARITTAAKGAEAPQPVRAEMIEGLFDGAGLALVVNGVEYNVTTLITLFNDDGTFKRLDFGAEVPPNTPDKAEITLIKK